MKLVQRTMQSSEELSWWHSLRLGQSQLAHGEGHLFIGAVFKGVLSFLSLLALLLVLGVAALRAQTVGSGDTYVGKAGDVFISEKEFVERFELLPALYRHRKPQLEGEKLSLLYSMIAEKLLAQEAVARKLDQDSLFQAAVNEVRKLLARDELYRVEVSDKVAITDKEIAQGMVRAVQQLLISFLFFEREEDASFVRAQLKTSEDFDRMRIDSTMAAVRDTATIVWGDAEPAIEKAVFGLKPGEISPVVRAGDGFYILKRSTLTQTSYYSSMAPHVLRERVAAKIRSRKEFARVQEYLKETLKEKVGYALPSSFKLLARSLMDVYTEWGKDSLITLSSEMVNELKHRCRVSLSDSFAVVGNNSWTLGDVIERLYAKRFAVPKEKIRSLPRLLNAEMSLMVQQELLAQEALRRNLDNRPEVRQDVEVWYQAYLADVMQDYAKKHVTVSDAEVWSYMKSRDQNVTVPQVQIRELRTGSIEEMREALGELQSGASFEQVIRKWSIDAEMRRREGVSDFFPITERAPLGEIAAGMGVGQRYGPLRFHDGMVFFELLAKRGAPSLRDTSFSGRKQELLHMKQRRTLNLFLAQLGKERGFAVFEDRLARIPVTSTPMMTFRFLGFGGRMFAVPFVQKQLEWLEIEPPATKVLP